jgi:hypothetical protein
MPLTTRVWALGTEFDKVPHPASFPLLPLFPMSLKELFSKNFLLNLEFFRNLPD